VHAQALSNQSQHWYGTGVASMPRWQRHGRWLQKRNQTAPIVQGSSLENVSILLLTHRLGQHQCQLNYLVGEYSNVLKLQLRELSTKRRGDARRQVSAFKTSCCRSRLAETILAEEH
jgi:hypothetical protein